MVSVCLPSDALLPHLLSFLGFSYLGHGVSLHGCSSKVQPLLLFLNKGYLLSAIPPDLERRVAPLGPPAPVQPLLLDQPKQHIKKQGHYFANKVHLVKAMVFPVVMYGCESWTIKKAERWKIDAFGLWVGEDSRESLGLQGDPTGPS